MPDLPQTRAGRHRSTSQTPATVLARALRRPSPRSLLKSLGVTTATLGLATAFASPPAAQDFQLASEERPAPQTAVAAVPAAPSRTQTYGLIGFGATAKTRAKATAKAAATRETAAASRSANYTRTGLSARPGMSDNAVAVINEVQRAFPELTDIGGYRPGDPGDHGSGHAVDVMCSSSQGDALVEHLQPMAATLRIKYIIWEQRIWYPDSGWKAMEDRGSPTANHYDHVHISVL